MSETLKTYHGNPNSIKDTTLGRRLLAAGLAATMLLTACTERSSAEPVATETSASASVTPTAVETSVPPTQEPTPVETTNRPSAVPSHEKTANPEREREAMNRRVQKKAQNYADRIIETYATRDAGHKYLGDSMVDSQYPDDRVPTLVFGDTTSKKQYVLAASVGYADGRMDPKKVHSVTLTTKSNPSGKPGEQFDATVLSMVTDGEGTWALGAEIRASAGAEVQQWGGNISNGDITQQELSAFLRITDEQIHDRIG